MQELQIVFIMGIQEAVGFKEKHGHKYQTPCPSILPQRDMNNCTILLLL